jgi:sugar lactone lactonase YvrE
MSRTAILCGTIVLVGALGAPPSASATTHTPSGTVTYTIPGDKVFPEGVAADPTRGVFYVSGTTDGTIYRGRLDRPGLEVFLPGGTDGRTTAIGLKLRAGLLYVAGGATGQMWVYDTRSRALIRHFDTGLRGTTFINDAAFDRAGNAYFTDSTTAVLWRVPAAAVCAGGDTAPAERFLDLTGTVVRYEAGFNLNGIAAEPDGRHLLTVQSNTGKLFRIDLPTRKASEVAVTGGTLTTGDGLLRLGRRLLVVRHVATATEHIEGVVTLTVHGSTARVVSTYTDPTFHWPTAAAPAHGRLLVVNSQFDRRSAGRPPALPFTVSGVALNRLAR